MFKTIQLNRYVYLGCLILLISYIVLTGFSSKSQTSETGSIGDIKYSLLPPDEFLPINTGWVLMDGQSIKGTPLSTLLAIDSIPDARGMFIRGMNEKRNDGKGNPEPKKLGEYQEDKIVFHKHDVLKANTVVEIHHKENGEKGIYGGNTATMFEDGNNKSAYTTLNQDVSMGAPETRPKNISVYIYVKIK